MAKRIQLINSKLGNPSKVMIDGESAGGMSVLLHNLMPQSWSLFDTSVIQSAGPWTLFSAQQASDINMRGYVKKSFFTRVTICLSY